MAVRQVQTAKLSYQSGIGTQWQARLMRRCAVPRERRSNKVTQADRLHSRAPLLKSILIPAALVYYTAVALSEIVKVRSKGHPQRVLPLKLVMYKPHVGRGGRGRWLGRDEPVNKNKKLLVGVGRLGGNRDSPTILHVKAAECSPLCWRPRFCYSPAALAGEGLRL